MAAFVMPIPVAAGPVYPAGGDHRRHRAVQSRRFRPSCRPDGHPSTYQAGVVFSLPVPIAQIHPQGNRGVSTRGRPAATGGVALQRNSPLDSQAASFFFPARTDQESFFYFLPSRINAGKIIFNLRLGIKNQGYYTHNQRDQVSPKHTTNL